MNEQRISRQQRKQSNGISDLVFGKIPPQAIDIEKAVIGTLLCFGDELDKATELLTTDSFYVDAHQKIFKAILNLAARFGRIDVFTVSEELKKTDDLENVGGQYYLTQTTNAIHSPAHLPNHCRIIAEKFIKRKIIEIGGLLVGEGFEDSTDPFELLEEAEKQISGIGGALQRQNYTSLNKAMVETYQHIAKLRASDRHLTGITSGFKELDQVTCGWQDTDLIILAARPSVGKTSVALSFARNAAMQKEVGGNVGFFSLEMSYRQLTTRLLSSESNIPMWLLRNAKLNDNQMKELYEKGVQPLVVANIFIDDTPSIKVSEIKSKARRMVNKEGVKIIFIDYLQLITAGQRFDRKDLEIGFISGQLKGLAKELHIPIVCLSQLSRDVEKRGGGKEPVLSDLRESGAIEQDADLVLFLWRPTDDEIGDDASLADMVNIKIEKNRNGSLERFLGKFIKETQRWDYLKIVDKKSFMPVGGESWKPYKED